MTANTVESDLIARVVPLFLKYEHSDDDTLLDAIVELGIDQQQAVGLLDFLPIAFFHVVAEGKIAGMPSHYVRYSTDRKPIANVRFMDEPIYVAARQYAENESDGFDSIVMRSAEFNSMNDMLHNGIPLERIRLEPSIVMDYSSDDSPISTRPWWRFW